MISLLNKTSDIIQSTYQENQLIGDTTCKLPRIGHIFMKHFFKDRRNLTVSAGGACNLLISRVQCREYSLQGSSTCAVTQKCKLFTLLIFQGMRRTANDS